MQTRKLAVEGAFEFVPETYHDHRGLFVAPFQEPAFLETVGRPFSVAQTNHSTSAAGVVRGVHFTRTPPGQDKYVYCPHGRALDVLVDVRVGSPTFGRWDAVEVDSRAFRSVYVPLGVGHAFVALQDETVMAYMVSGTYVAADEFAVHPMDPGLGLPWPPGAGHLSEKDASAPTLAEARELGLLPSYVDCLSPHVLEAR